MALEALFQAQATHDLVGKTITRVRLAFASENRYVHEIEFTDGSLLQVCEHDHWPLIQTFRADRWVPVDPHSEPDLHFFDASLASRIGRED